LSSVAQLVEVDDALYGQKGVLGRIMRCEGREALLEEVWKEGRTGLTIRQALLDIGAREFGMKPLNLAQVVPRLLPAPAAPEEARTFYHELRRRLEDGHALIIADAISFALVELLERREGEEGGLQVIVGLIPWNYVLVASKTPKLRDAIGLKDDDPKWATGVAFELLLDDEEPLVRVVSQPEDPVEADEVFQWLWAVLHRNLFAPPAVGERPNSKSWLGPA